MDAVVVFLRVEEGGRLPYIARRPICLVSRRKSHRSQQYGSDGFCGAALGGEEWLYCSTARAVKASAGGAEGSQSDAG
jgi:hypothetical protein